MCGIAGIWNYEGEVPAALRLKAMLDAMRHRGPDGRGSHSFVGGACGMVRLSLVDLSPRGDQPMWSACRGVAIVFNGEIYNFRELRERLRTSGHTFQSTSDTEVILASYLEHGLHFVDKLRGMFAVAIFDWREQGTDRPPTVTLARSPLGIKPLYVAEVGPRHETVVFSSELRSLLASGLVERHVSRSGLSDYLQFGVVMQPQTMIEGVRMLAPGTLEQFVPGRARTRVRFWSIPPYEPRNESFDDAAARLRSEIDESVRLHALADAPLGAFLSGGVDSTAITTLMRPHVSSLHTYTFRFPDVPGADEVDEAKRTAERLDCEHHVVDFTGADALRLLPVFADEIDQPSIDGMNTWIMSRAAARDVKGVLSGVGGDEWFAGYPVTGRMLRTESTLSGRLRKSAAWIAHALRKYTPVDGLRNRLDAAAAYRTPTALWLHPHSVFSPPESAALLGLPGSSAAWEKQDDELRSVLRSAAGDDGRNESMIGVSCLLDHYVFMMCRLLRDSDAAGMASSIELRLPFVDLRIAEFSRSCHDEYKLTVESAKQRRTKLVLQHALRDLLPAEISRRPKRGFTIPNAHWMRRELSSLVAEICDPATVRRRGWLDPTIVQRFNSPRSSYRRAPHPQLWSMLILELWARAVFDGPVPSFSPDVECLDLAAASTPSAGKIGS